MWYSKERLGVCWWLHFNSNWGIHSPQYCHKSLGEGSYSIVLVRRVKLARQHIPKEPKEKLSILHLCSKCQYDWWLVKPVYDRINCKLLCGGKLDFGNQEPQLFWKCILAVLKMPPSFSFLLFLSFLYSFLFSFNSLFASNIFNVIMLYFFGFIVWPCMRPRIFGFRRDLCYLCRFFHREHSC